MDQEFFNVFATVDFVVVFVLAGADAGGILVLVLVMWLCCCSCCCSPPPSLRQQPLSCGCLSLFGFGVCFPARPHVRVHVRVRVCAFQQLRVRDFTKLMTSPVFGVTAAERAAKGGAEAAGAGVGGLTLRDYQLEVGVWADWIGAGRGGAGRGVA